MINPRLSYLAIFIFSLSCSVEKINLSPVGAAAYESTAKSPAYSLTEKQNLIVYSSEITNLLATFPKFRNDAVNREVIRLSYYLKDYIGAIEEHNKKGLEKSTANFEKSYKKLQTLRRYLNKDEDEVLNRYLVRIKTNLSQINNNLPKDSTAAP
ncbi:hypothetical protein [Kaistella palustris]|uniref:hypothetical protein n=1 Tax=Kaistella palustris TaxID=493376 RepID=UPI0004143132|nr:hypothetical protein [Kaistella palustris]